MEILTAVKEIVVTSAAATGAIVALLGLRSWREQHRGKANHELARRLLRSGYRVRDALRWVRNSMMSSSEIYEALKGKGHSDEEIQARKFDLPIDEIVYQSRWQKVQDAFADFGLESLEAEVLWGSETKQQLIPLRECVSKLRRALMRHLRDGKGGRPQLSPEKRNELDKLIYDDVDEDDEFSQEIDAAIKAIETLARPKLDLR